MKGNLEITPSQVCVIVGFWFACFILAYIIMFLIKFFQYRKFIGVNIFPLGIIIQIAKINKLAQRIDDKFILTWENLITTFKRAGVVSSDDYPYDDNKHCGKKISIFKFLKKGNRILIDRIPLQFVEYTNSIDLGDAQTAKEMMDKICKELDIPKFEITDWGKQNLEVQQTKKAIYDKVLLTLLIYNYIGAKLDKRDKDVKFFKKLAQDFCLAHKIKLTKIEDRILNGTPARQEAVNYSWRFEQIYILCYCLGLTDNFVSPASMSQEDLDELVQDYRVENVKVNENRARQVYSVYYVLVNHKEISKFITKEVCEERLIALQWLFGL